MTEIEPKRSAMEERSSDASYKRYRVNAITLATIFVAFAAYIFSQIDVGASFASIFDNIHSTACCVVAAWLGFIGIKSATENERRGRTWFARGLAANACGQVLWNFQIYADWNTIPAPSDFFFLMLGPSFALGLWQELRSSVPKPELKATTLDTIAITLGATTLALATTMPPALTLHSSSLLLASIYPMTLFAAFSAGTVLLTRAPCQRSDSMYLVLSLLFMSIVWLMWDMHYLQGTLIDGSFISLLFSLSVLSLGYASMIWRPPGPPERRISNLYLRLRRNLPVTMFILVVSSITLARSIQVQYTSAGLAVILGSTATIAVVLWRQNAKLSERDRHLEIERRLRESEARYNTLFMSSMDGVFLLKGTKIVDCNEQSLEMLRCNRSSIVGVNLVDLIAKGPSNGPDLSHTVAKLGAQRSISFDLLLKRQDGSTFDAEANMRSLEVNQRKVVQLVVRDISDRIAAQEALRMSEARFSISFESASIGMALTDKTGRFFKVNSAFCRIVGYTPAELTLKTFQDITHPEDLETGLASLSQSLAGLADHHQMEKRYLHSSGTVVPVLVSVALVRDYRNRPLHFTTQIQDLTQSKKLEQQLRQAQKMEAVGQLAGGLAHDFNNILTVIQGYASLLQANNIDSKEGASEISSAVERAAGLTRQLLTFSRKQIMLPQQLAINTVVQEMAGLLRTTLGPTIVLQIELGLNLPSIMADRGMLEQILLNLAVNARDAMPDGGPLTISTSATTISDEDVRLFPNAKPTFGVSLKVTDGGCGIPPAVLPHIFEPFFTTKEVNKGSGLGLATVHGIVHQHHGILRVSTEIGIGTMIEAVFPGHKLQREVTNQLHPNQHDAPIQGGTETILLVDDEPALRLVAAKTLSHYGYQVIEAESGPHALKIIEDFSGTIDLLITDMVMPGGIGGKELAETLVRSGRVERVIYMSGYSAELLKLSNPLPPNIWFLPKPFTSPTLARMVRSCYETSATAS